MLAVDPDTTPEQMANSVALLQLDLADPDFHAESPRAFAVWFFRFFRTYFGWREFAALAAVLGLYLFVLGASPLSAAASSSPMFSSWPEAAFVAGATMGSGRRSPSR